MTVQTFANPQVLEFYKALPFNYYGSVEDQAKSVLKQGTLADFYNMKNYLGRETTLLDVGCGTGWFAMAMSHFEQCQVTGIDFNAVAIERAKEVAQELKLDINFSVEDLFLYQPQRKFDFVNSLGVLHHTDNCHEALRHIFRSLVKDGGHVHIGLYHDYGRRVFLKYFEELKSDGLTREELFDKFKEMHSPSADQTFLQSWFRDQVLHPKETQHTLQEMMGLFDDENVRLVFTSINKFQPIEDINEIYSLEKDYEQRAEQGLSEKKYFPGFFTFLVEKLN